MADHKDKKRENVLDLNKYLDSGVRVKFQGGREVTGVLKGYDQLVNLVLDDCLEFVKGESRNYVIDSFFCAKQVHMLAQHCCEARAISVHAQHRAALGQLSIKSHCQAHDAATSRVLQTDLCIAAV
jgi:small nuclear ribonucleoprotein (snRNP)-like protein